jgi:membrane-associated phospholipid phosphatase
VTPEALLPDDALHAEGADAGGHIPDDIRHPPWLLIGAGAVALAVLILGLVGTLIDRGWQFGFDSSILLAMRGGTMHGTPIGPVWLKQAMIDVTAMGGETALTFWLVLGGTISGSVAVGIAKALIGRARPALTDHLVQVTSASFPSGHAANSAIIYLTIASLIVQIVEERRARTYILIVAALLVTAIGVSRVYLGVHWPSDVIAGWSFGTLWALAWWSLGAWARLRRAGVTFRAT